ncbi:phosphoenolpyruvate--protein phosphotransferase [Paenibacillus rigui]|uniref:Phosphoenolpyruvate-protein phosphotransferase n=1 Tax=Paenibacillus rigui TaxID=554312 RepID=A0A229UPQ8_9BACL|nr:phosphoenolpyruvate--protein phosphotransferase [Paenibacillus rigui]OXM85363.1 phosphoenolpyruvate--protein phosphotransferase [Paenibacillus rigui]
MSNRLEGIAASPGIAIAPAYVLKHTAYVPTRSAAEDPAFEAHRFREALAQAKQELQSIRDLTEARLGAQKAEIFEAHLLLLEDPDLIDVVFERIEKERIHAEFALYDVSQGFIDMLLAMDNELLRERAADVRDVSGRMLSRLRGEAYSTISDIAEEAIVIAEDLTPSDTAQLDLQVVRGFVTEIGSRTSHSAIMARSLGIPAIVGAGEEVRQIVPGTTIILDASEGRVILDPSPEELDAYRQKKEQYDRRRSELAKLKDQPTASKDGHTVELAANIGSTEDLQKVLDNGAEGVGLFRTEFLYMGRSTFPTEEEQFSVYKHVLEKMDGKPVVIRTLDIGGDKELSYMKLPQESNPFLGLRALRLCLDRQDLFRTQLRALLRASRYGLLKIMFPMIAVLEELEEAKRLLQEEKAKLLQEGHAISDKIEVGMMIEVPAAALAADQFAKEVDFFSIGTNDLIQYTMAADRMNEQVAYLYQPCHPAILRLIHMVIQAAEAEGRWVGMCGEMAGDETAIPLLLGMGLHEFSMSASSILPARALIRDLNKAEWSGRIPQVLAMRSQADITDYVNKFLRSEA